MIVPIDLAEWTRLTPESDSPLAGAVLEAPVRAQAEALSRAGMLEVVELRKGLEIGATSYVGRIQLGQWRITVRPKIIGAPFLRLLRYAYGLRNLSLLSPAEHGLEADAFQDLLCHQLGAEASELLARGLHRAYQRVEEPLVSPRGKISF